MTIYKLKGTSPTYKLHILLRKLNSDLKKFEGSDLLESCWIQQPEIQGCSSSMSPGPTSSEVEKVFLIGTPQTHLYGARVLYIQPAMQINTGRNTQHKWPYPVTLSGCSVWKSVNRNINVYTVQIPPVAGLRQPVSPVAGIWIYKLPRLHPTLIAGTDHHTHTRRIKSPHPGK